jgi:hypothetical protein
MISEYVERLLSVPAVCPQPECKGGAWQVNNLGVAFRVYHLGGIPRSRSRGRRGRLPAGPCPRRAGRPGVAGPAQAGPGTFVVPPAGGRPGGDSLRRVRGKDHGHPDRAFDPEPGRRVARLRTSSGCLPARARRLCLHEEIRHPGPQGGGTPHRPGNRRPGGRRGRAREGAGSSEIVCLPSQGSRKNRRNGHPDGNGPERLRFRTEGGGPMAALQEEARKEGDCWERREIVVHGCPSASANPSSTSSMPTWPKPS